ncbi:MAG: DNA polymerase III subunit epsilon [Alphaproteobacteria bacterium GM7ARS4]|nr:DNA polymerase III subunit epsilon [Alphaproteobacteria bacterium GM7ARS4]
MREIVLDTETTGLDVEKGERIVEIACVVLQDRKLTGEEKQWYINPGKPVGSSFDIHGLSDDFLRDKPFFSSIMGSFLAFIGDSPLVIHHAAFDMAFLEHALREAGGPSLKRHQVIDTLELARSAFPNSRVSLDDLCQRFHIDLSSRRQGHGGLIDARLLARVYLSLLLRDQRRLLLDVEEGSFSVDSLPCGEDIQGKGFILKHPCQEERDAHAFMVKGLEGSLWKEFVNGR